MKQTDKQYSTDGPMKELVSSIHSLRLAASPTPKDHRLSDAYRDVLRRYREEAISGHKLDEEQRQLTKEALRFLGGDADRQTSSLRDYDHRRYGPFLGVSDEGGAAVAIRRAAFACPKAKALKGRVFPLTLGVALDAERLGGVGEVPVGPDEHAEIWLDCVGRLLRTTNVGSRANLRLYRRAPVVTVAGGNDRMSLENAKKALGGAFKPFLDAPGGPRPLTVSVEFEFERKRSPKTKQKLLRELLDYVKTGGIAASDIQTIALQVRIGWGAKGRDATIQAINLAKSVGIKRVVVDGVVRKEADAVISLPGLLNYLPPNMVAPILKHASKQGVDVSPVNPADADTVAREIWTALNTARGMGLDLGKYGLFPLSLEDCDHIIDQIQRWFPDWSAAPVFYVDQGIIARDCLYVEKDTAKGIEVWLRMLNKHGVRLCLIDTVDKSQGWKILKSGNDPKGLLTVEQIAKLSALGEKLGVNTLWAGGLSIEQAYELGKVGVFGIYVTTSASNEAPVTGEYKNDPELPAEKKPTFMGVLNVKTVLEAGYLSSRLPAGPIRDQVINAGLDAKNLSAVLPEAWQFWWNTLPEDSGKEK